MGKRRVVRSKLQPRDGIITVSFTLAGKRTTKTHALNEFETKHMMELCIKHGEEAAGQIVWKGAMKMAEILARNCLAEAGRDLAQSNQTEKKEGEAT